MHDAAHALRDQVEATPGPIWAVVTEAGELGVDQAGIDLAQFLVSQPGAGHHGGAIVLHQDIRPLHQLEEDLPALRLFVIEGDALLVAVDVAEVPVSFVPVSHGPRGVPLAGAFDLDHLGPHVRQHHGAKRAGHVFGQVQHPQAVQGREALPGSIVFLSHVDNGNVVDDWGEEISFVYGFNPPSVPAFFTSVMAEE